MTGKDALDGKDHTFLGRSLRWVKPGHIVSGVSQRHIEEAFTELNLKKDPTAKKMPAWIKQPAEQVPLDEDLQSRYRSIIGKMVWLDRADIRPAVIRLGSQLGKATESDLKNAERVWSYPWETRGKTQVICPMVMGQMDTLEAGGCLTMSDSDMKNAERVWSYLWETRGKTQMIYPMVMDQMDTLEEGGCLTMSDSDWA